jgi:hypothetical protein
MARPGSPLSFVVAPGGGTRREVGLILSKLTVAMRTPLVEHGARRLSPAATMAVCESPRGRDLAVSE